MEWRYRCSEKKPTSERRTKPSGERTSVTSCGTSGARITIRFGRGSIEYTSPCTRPLAVTLGARCATSAWAQAPPPPPVVQPFNDGAYWVLIKPFTGIAIGTGKVLHPASAGADGVRPFAWRRDAARSGFGRHLATARYLSVAGGGPLCNWLSRANRKIPRLCSPEPICRSLSMAS